MPNNYVQTSFTTPCTEEEFKIFQRLAAGVTGEELFNKDVDKLELLENLIGWTWEFEEDELWIYMEEGALIDPMVDLLQEFLKKTNRDDAIKFTWSETCSKMHVDAFSGGGVFITKDGSSLLCVGSWLEEQEKKHKNGTWVPDPMPNNKDKKEEAV